mmetsp:Transcript_45546/g.45983  ORF Transcript_45546/g.45983 Transcript_45546/m.45983 type:complete len:106 (-) Transcript_45546:143-460(-)
MMALSNQHDLEEIIHFEEETIHYGEGTIQLQDIAVEEEVASLELERGSADRVEPESGNRPDTEQDMSDTLLDTPHTQAPAHVTPLENHGEKPASIAVTLVTRGAR